MVETALAEAKDVLENEIASREELELATIKLVKAFGGLEYGIQKVHLETAIAFADNILALENNFEEADVQALKAANENGKIVYADLQATQEEVDVSVYEILDVLARLSKKADVESLESLIEAAKALPKDQSRARPRK